MKYLTLLLSAFICIAWFSCKQDPTLPEPSALVNDTTGVEIPSIPVDTPKIPPSNPADTFIGTYKGFTKKSYGYYFPPNPPQTFDTTYADEVIVYKDSTDKYNTFHIRFPNRDYLNYSSYDTMQFTYSVTNQYMHIFNNYGRITIKVFPSADSIYYNNVQNSQVNGVSATFTGKR